MIEEKFGGYTDPLGRADPGHRGNGPDEAGLPRRGQVLHPLPRAAQGHPRGQEDRDQPRAADQGLHQRRRLEDPRELERRRDELLRPERPRLGRGPLQFRPQPDLHRADQEGPPGGRFPHPRPVLSDRRLLRRLVAREPPPPGLRPRPQPGPLGPGQAPRDGDPPHGQLHRDDAGRVRRRPGLLERRHAARAVRPARQARLRPRQAGHPEAHLRPQRPLAAGAGRRPSPT